MSHRVVAAIWALLCAVVGIVLGLATSVGVGVGVAVVLFLGPVIAYWRGAELTPPGHRR